MLKTQRVKFHKVESGQTLKEIAKAYDVSEFLLAKINRLTAPLRRGQLLVLPTETGNAYLVKEGDTKALLAGDKETFQRKNGTDAFYIGMRVIL